MNECSKRMLIASGRSNEPLAQNIATALGQPLEDIEVKNFNDKEIGVKYNENVRGSHLFIIQSTNPPAENILELLIMIDAAKRASANEITVVIPYYGYGRMDRKDEGRVAISAKLMADLINVAGAHRIVSMDLHSSQIQGFSDGPFDHLYGSLVFKPVLMQSEKNYNAAASPDVGRIKMARAYAQKILPSPGQYIDILAIDKRRHAAGSAEVMNIIGDAAGKRILIVDDMIDTASTLCNAAQAFMGAGAESVDALATHLILSNNAVERIQASPLGKVYTTNTIHHTKRYSKIEVVDASAAFGEAIKNIFEHGSVSAVFDSVH